MVFQLTDMGSVQTNPKRIDKENQRYVLNDIQLRIQQNLKL